MFVSQMAFFAKISDPAVGGTYMTLINTLANMGSNWPTTLALWLVDGFTMKQCSIDGSNSCANPTDVKVSSFNSQISYPIFFFRLVEIIQEFAKPKSMDTTLKYYAVL